MSGGLKEAVIVMCSPQMCGVFVPQLAALTVRIELAFSRLETLPSLW